MSATHTMPSPELVFDTLFAYQKSAALRAAIDLDVFTAIDEGAQTASDIAHRTGASERGIRILCDYLTVHKLLSKSDSTYRLVPESAAFLSKKSPAYLGTTARFLTMPALKDNFDHLTESVRRGGASDAENTVSNDNPIWQEFARSMVPMMMPNAHAIAELVGASTAAPAKVLDIAAGHGMFGITIAQRNPRAEIYAVDWKPVLAVAREHADAAGVSDRYHTIPGDAFQVEYGDGYDLALITNFLHHFDAPTCTRLMKKVYAALKPGGRAVLLEFVPNPDRVTPAIPAGFSLTMLAGTQSGDAHTFSELRQQLEAAGFVGVEAHSTPTPETIVLARK